MKKTSQVERNNLRIALATVHAGLANGQISPKARDKLLAALIGSEVPPDGKWARNPNRRCWSKTILTKKRYEIYSYPKNQAMLFETKGLGGTYIAQGKVRELKRLV